MSKPKKHYAVRSFFSYLKKYRVPAILVMICFIISNVLLALLPVFIGRLVGALAANPIEKSDAIMYVWILIACSSGHNLTWRASEILHMKLMNHAAYLYENILFRKVIEKPYPYFVDKFTGKISSYITTISQELREFLNVLFYDYTSQVVNLVVIAVILSSVNWQTGVIFITSIVLTFLIGKYTIKNNTKYEKAWADVQSTKNGKLIDAIANFVNVKSFQQEHLEVKTIESEQQKTVAAARVSYKWAIIFWGSISFVIRDLMWPATIGLNVYLFLQGDISVTEITTLLTTILLFSNTIWNFIWHISQLNLKFARVEEAHRYLFGETNIMKDEAHAAETLEKRKLEQELELRGLSFAYPDKVDTPVLSDINLKVKKGEKVGIVGRSGSGKTTLTKLLLGYYDTTPEQMLLDGEPIKGKQLASLISYVPQDTSLFHRSVAENIAYASREPVTRQDIIAASKQAHAHEFISQITDGYDALVGERGVKLSAGQRQRIAIARALLDNKPLLILDEATSALDSESEVLVQEGLEALWEKKTVLAIAHRLSTLRHMDTIIVMDRGEIVERGSHNELLTKNGAYAKLWAHQSGGFLEED